VREKIQKLEGFRPALHRRVVVTGGPGGGKTTAVDMFRREMGPALTVVPEAATILFGGGFPRSAEPAVVEATQAAIYHVQRHLEDARAAFAPGPILLCDRGTVDGAVYWPTKPADFFAAVGSSLEAELARYDAVLFFESAASGGMAIEGGNPNRIESGPAAAALDRRLREIWSGHPRFVFVAHETSFFQKIAHGLAELKRLCAELGHDDAHR
jgi:predicted ATPase